MIMNANELADWLNDPLGYKMGEIATMLRQQQAEIEALKTQRMQITEDGRIRPIFQLLSEDELKKLADDYVNAYGYPFPAVSYGLEIQRRILK
jgi:hypothetical protein